MLPHWLHAGWFRWQSCDVTVTCSSLSTSVSWAVTKCSPARPGHTGSLADRRSTESRCCLENSPSRPTNTPSEGPRFSSELVKRYVGNSLTGEEPDLSILLFDLMFRFYNNCNQYTTFANQIYERWTTAIVLFQFEILEEFRREKLDELATKIQTLWRGFSTRLKWEKLKASQIVISTCWKRWKDRSHIDEIKQQRQEQWAAVTIQRAVRSWNVS